MEKNFKSIAKSLGASVVDELPDVGGGAFGAARLAQIISQKLTPSQGKRPGRPSNAAWVKRPKVPMSLETFVTLNHMAESLSENRGRKVSPMQLAAQILEEGVRSLEEVSKTGTFHRKST